MTFGELVWYLSTQVNDDPLAAYINAFDPSRGKCRPFITFLVYALVYLSISSNILTFDNLSPWSDSIYMRT